MEPNKKYGLYISGEPRPVGYFLNQRYYECDRKVGYVDEDGNFIHPTMKEPDPDWRDKVKGSIQGTRLDVPDGKTTYELKLLED